MNFINSPKISIVMGIYNCQKTLNESVQCILNQTYSNWELIMCDDGSVDNTYEVAKKLASKDSRIIVIKNEKNIGLAPTLNHCLEYATGELIARMDGDDICSFDRLEKECDFLLNNNEYSFVSCNMDCYDEQGVFRKINYREKPLLNDFINGSQFCHAGCMIRKRALLDVHGYDVSKEVERVEDYDLWVRLYCKGYKGYNIQEVLYSMRDDRNALKRRKFIYRVNEMKIRKRVYYIANMTMRNSYKIYIPVLKGIVPTVVYKYCHSRQK